MNSWRGLLFFLIFFTLYIAMMPQTPGTGLDASWSMTLSRGLENDKQFGSDIVFTYGPLGAILIPQADGRMIGAKIALILALCALVAVVLWMIWRKMPKAAGIVFLAGLILSPMAALPPLEGLLIVAMAALVLLGTRAVSSREAWLLVALCILITVPAALCKFTLAAVSVCMVLACAIALWGAGYALAAATLAAIWWPAMLTVGMMAGQQRGAVRDYMRWGWEVARGYEQMSVPAATGSLIQGILLFSTGVLLILWGTYRVARMNIAQRARLGMCAGLSGAMLALFLFWKHGFTRADAHVRIFFGYAPLILILLSVLPQGIWRKNLLAWLCAAGLFMCISESSAARGSFTSSLPGNALVRITENWNYLMHSQERQNESRKVWKAIAFTRALPQLAMKTRKDTVDFLGADLDHIFSSGMKYRGRPVFQSYTAITGPLAKLNEQFLNSSRAPQWILCSLRSMGLDGHFPPSEDSLGLWSVLRNYDLAGEEKEILLLQKVRDAAPDPCQASVLTEGISHIGEALTVPHVEDGCLWFQATVKFSPWGKVRSSIYQQPILWMHLQTAEGVTEKYRFLPYVAESGFLIHPFLRDNNDVRLALTGQGATPITVTRVTIEASSDAASNCYNSEFNYRIRRLPSLRP